MMNLSNLKKVSTFAFGIIAGFAIDKYANAENVSKLKARASEAYEKLSNKLANATEPKVEYVQEEEVSVDPTLKDNNIELYCTPEHSADLYDYMSRELKHKKYITIAEIMETKWLDQKTTDHFIDHFTFDECLTYGWNYNTTYWLNRKSGTNYVSASYPEDLTDIIYEKEPDIDVGDITVDDGCLTQATDIMGDKSEGEDVLFIGIIGFNKLSDAYYAMSCVLERLVDKKSYFTVYELVQDLFEDEPDMFDYITKEYDSNTLMKYGWVDPSAFEIRFNRESGKYIITDVAPVRLYTNEEKKNENKNTEPNTGSAEDTNVM